MSTFIVFIGYTILIVLCLLIFGFIDYVFMGFYTTYKEYREDQRYKKDLEKRTRHLELKRHGYTLAVRIIDEYELLYNWSANSGTDHLAYIGEKRGIVLYGKPCGDIQTNLTKLENTFYELTDLAKEMQDNEDEIKAKNKLYLESKLIK